MTVTENEITNNWTDGVLFLDGSGGTNIPVQQALTRTSTTTTSAATGTARSSIVRPAAHCPAPGTNLKNFSGNWWGTTPVFTSANSTEPGYAAQIPVEFGGSATPPGGQPDIPGPASGQSRLQPVPRLRHGHQRRSGFGTIGFQGSYNVLDVPTKGAQTASSAASRKPPISSPARSSRSSRAPSMKATRSTTRSTCAARSTDSGDWTHSRDASESTINGTLDAQRSQHQGGRLLDREPRGNR